MTVALFKSVLKTDEGDTVWDKLKQKIVDAAEAPAHIADGWYQDAAEALEAHELAKLEADNAKLEANIAAEQAKLDGRTKAARELKAKGAQVELKTDGPTVEEFVAAGYQAANYPPDGYTSRSTPDEIDAAIKAQAPADPPAA